MNTTLIAYDPKTNIEAGIKRREVLIHKWGVELALAVYNAGEGAVARFKCVPPYRETRSYVSRISRVFSKPGHLRSSTFGSAPSQLPADAVAVAVRLVARPCAGLPDSTGATSH